MVLVTRITVPEPWGLGGVNAYLLHTDEPTIIDPGPDLPEARKKVQKAVADAGYAFTDIDHILVTHPHSDHFGNASWVREETGATVHAHADMAAIVESFDKHKERQQEFFPSYLERMGVPRGIAEEVVDAYLPNRVDRTLPVDDHLTHGDCIDLGETSVKVFHAPGHARGNSCFLLDEESTAFTGDHVLADITPNPTLQIPDEGDTPPNSLGMYLESLRSFPKTIEKGRGGHKGVITDLPARITAIINHHNERLDRIHSYLDEPVTPYVLMQQFFSDLPEREIFLGMSEIIGHLRVLEDRRDIIRESNGDRFVFHAL